MSTRRNARRIGKGGGGDEDEGGMAVLLMAGSCSVPSPRLGPPIKAIRPTNQHPVSGRNWQWKTIRI
jgi:hypothetical protein